MPHINPDHRQRAAELLDEASTTRHPGDLIAEARHLLGWTQVQLGEHLDAPIQNQRCRTVQSWESGQRSPGWGSREAIEQLAEDLREGAL